MTDLKRLVARERDLWRALQNSELDVRVAARDGDSEAEAHALLQQKAAGEVWHAAYGEAKAALYALLADQDIAAADVRHLFNA